MKKARENKRKQNKKLKRGTHTHRRSCVFPFALTWVWFYCNVFEFLLRSHQMLQNSYAPNNSKVRHGTRVCVELFRFVWCVCFSFAIPFSSFFLSFEYYSCFFSPNSTQLWTHSFGSNASWIQPTYESVYTYLCCHGNVKLKYVRVCARSFVLSF